MKTISLAALAKGFLITGLIVLGLGLKQVQAASTDTITLSVTPGNLTYAVTITSVNPSGYQFGTVNLNDTTISTSAIGVLNSGNIAEYFVLRVGNTAPDNWAPTTGVPATDNFRLMGYFNGPAGTQPADGSFSSTIVTGFGATGAGTYNQGGKTNPGTSTNLWLRLNMPQFITGTGGAQTMVLYIAGQGT